MRRLLFISLAVVCTLSLAACADKKSASAPSVGTLDESPPAVSAAPVPAESKAAESPQPAENQDAEASPVITGSSSIIAESSNTVSDKEKQAILDKLSSQIDNALNDTQNLEDVDDSDLDTNNIE
jgi:hypothetical protein